MANSITLAKNYVALLDEVYKEAALTSVLDSDPTGMRQGANAHEILIQKLSMDGLADYSRNSGYVKGNVKLEWETVQFNYDRGRMFEVDSMDENQGSAGRRCIYLCTAGIRDGNLQGIRRSYTVYGAERHGRDHSRGRRDG